MSEYRKIASFKTADEFRDYLKASSIDIPLDDEVKSGPGSVLSSHATISGHEVGNRFCILPMEGWDCELDGNPGPLTVRRWERFGESGAKLMYGTEAAAVCHEGRSNTRQLMIAENTVAGIEKARKAMLSAHIKATGSEKGYLAGLQLTHSGRFSKPNDDHNPEPVIVYNHPILDKRIKPGAKVTLLTDSDIERLIEKYINAALLAQKAGFDFVDLKHCHGYLTHELLSAVTRPGKFGGSFENRTRFLRELVAGIRAKAPDLMFGCRLSLFDFVPFKKGPDNVGVPEEMPEGKYLHAFGGDGTGLGIDLTETYMFLDLLKKLDIKLVCTTVGSPYYNPHIQRPAMFPPSDGYRPPEDPLAGVARQIKVVADVKKKFPELFFISAGLTYLQEFLPNVAQHLIGNGMTDFAGLGRMVLSYPWMPADVLAGRPLQKKCICRTFSECTTAPRNGLVSGCYPLDHFYRELPDYKELAEMKKK